MRYFILDIIPKIQSFSKKLDDLALLTNQSWVSVNEINTSKTVFIFRTNKQLLISENGRIDKGATWEHLGNNSLIIDKGNESYLFKHGFLDETVLAMKVDGLDEYAVFLNETKYGREINNINDLTAFLEAKYLLKHDLSKHLYSDTHALDNRIESVRLTNGGEMVFYPSERNETIVIEGCKVKISGQTPENGLYKSTSCFRFEIIDGVLHKEFRIHTHKQSNGLTIEVDCYRLQNSMRGSRVWLNDRPAPDGHYETGTFSSINVRNGVVL